MLDTVTRTAVAVSDDINHYTAEDVRAILQESLDAAHMDNGHWAYGYQVTVGGQ